MPRSATSWLPRAWHEGPCGEGSGSGGDVGPRHGTVGVPTVRYGVASSSGRNCFALRGLARFYRNPMGTGLCERCALSGSWRRNAPERSPRDPAKQGSGSGGDVKTAPRICWGVCIPLRGRIFLRKRLLRPSRCAPEPRGPAKRGSGSGGDAGDRTRTLSGRKQRYGVASSFGRDCSALRGAPRSVARGAPRSGDRAAAGMQETAPGHCRGANSPLRGRIFLRKRLLRPSRSIHVVPFRAAHPAKPPSRQRRLVQGFPR
jgi:hypothetical protein